jgi:hypothetical protein
MPGRPKGKARAAIKLLEAADILAAQTVHHAPFHGEADRRKPAKPSRVEKLWSNAKHATAIATVALEELAQALASRAGMDQPFSGWTMGETPEVTLARMTEVATKAGVPPPSRAEVERMHARRDEARVLAQASAEGWDDDLDEDYDDLGENEDEPAMASAGTAEE